MTASKLTTRSLRLAGVLLPLLVAYASPAYGQSQMPLLAKAGATVPPNVMLTMDDSGSMAFRHMPENVFAGGTFATANPVLSRTVFWDKNDNFQNGVSALGTVPGDVASANYRLRALRSVDTNTIFYNPEIRYQPWLTADGVTRLPNSPVATAYKDPLVRTGAAGTFIDLTAVSPMGTGVLLAYPAGSFVVGYTYTILTQGSTNFTLIGAANNNVGTVFRATGVGAGSGTAGGSLSNWCFANANNGDCTPATARFDHDAGVYFRLTKTAGVYNAVGTYTNYTPFSINSTRAGRFVVGTQYKITLTGTTPFTSIGAGSNAVGTVFTATGVGSGTGIASQNAFTKYPDRIDCAGATCTQTDERQNFANWFSYYRTRNLLARGSLMEAFAVEATPVTAGTFVIGSSYAVVSIGTTNFTLIGGSNTVGAVFTATGLGAGTGTARPIAMRLGFGRINKGSATVDGASTRVIESNTATYGGGGVRDFNAARKAQLYKWLEDLPANGSTPLVEAMQSVGEYYSRTSTQGPWTDNPAVNSNVVTTNKTCRRSYNIMMTDGYWNGSPVAVGNQDNAAGSTIIGAGASYQYQPVFPYKDAWSNTLADVAMRYWKTDLQSATDNKVPPVGENMSFWQNMTNFTVGLGVRGTLDPAVDLPALVAGTKVWPLASTSTNSGANVDDLWHAAVNSRGRYFSAKDPAELSTAIRTALAGATGGDAPGGGVATASTTLQAGNRKYVPGYHLGTWDGDIVAFPLDVLGQVTAAVWKASDHMPAFAARNIVTWDASAGVAIPFAWASMSADSKTALGATAATYTTQFIDFLKGDHSQEGVSHPANFRTRLTTAGTPFVLGDSVNSIPVLVQANFDGKYTDPAFGGASAYTAFKATKAARTAVLFAGANDGMLHAFKDSKGATSATDGEEVFAYVPRTVYPNLYKLADPTYGTSTTLPHQYFVDGPLHEADAYVKAPAAGSASWRNYLFGSLGAGGRAVFALDVTDTAAMGLNTVRWEISSADDADLGYVLTAIKVGVLPNGRWVAIFGNGFASTNGYASLFVVDIEDAASSNAGTRAAAIQKLNLDTTGGNGLGGVTVIPNLVTGRTENIYVGDLKGKLWKLKYDSSAPSKFAIDAGDSVSPFFTAKDGGGVAQPITSSPAVFIHQSGGRQVVFATGKLLDTADATDTSAQSVYSVWDKQAGSAPVTDTVPRPMTRANLAVRTLTTFAGTGLAASTTFVSSTGAAVDYSGLERGWYIDLSSTIAGGRVLYPIQVAGYATALVSSVAPVQGTPLACESAKGTALNLLVPVESGTDPLAPMFDVNGDGVANSSDSGGGGGGGGGPSTGGGTGGVGYKTEADGTDAVVTSGSSDGAGLTNDFGGGGSEGDCSGANCSKKGKKCVQSTACAAGKCLVSIQSATMAMAVCLDPGALSQRVWRRIINPPIH